MFIVKIHFEGVAKMLKYVRTPKGDYWNKNCIPFQNGDYS